MPPKTGTILLTYRINSRNADVIKEMEKKGYMDRWGERESNKVHILPHGTLWHNYKSATQAVKDLKDVCITLSILVESVIAVVASDFTGL